MTRRRTIGRTDRGVSSSVTHALALGITAILISGLLFTAGTLLEDQRENSAREQLRTVGNRMADDLSRAAVLAQDGGNVSLRTRHPTTIAGRSYLVQFLTGSDCDTDLFDADACLRLDLGDGGTSVMVPVRNETDVSFERTSSGSYSISATANASATSPTAPHVTRDLRIGIGDDVGGYATGSTLNLTNRDPIAGFTFTPGQPNVSSVIHFQNDTKDLDGVITTYEWDVNGDGTVDHTGREFNYSYPSPGKYTVTLTVTDDDGDTDEVSKVVSVGGLVYDGPPDANNVSGTSTEAALDFTIENHHGAEVEILNLLVDPQDDTIDRLGVSGSEAEVAIDADVDDDEYTSSVDILADGRIVDLTEDWDSAALSAGSSADVRLAGFQRAGSYTDMDGKRTFVAIRYVVDGTYYTSQFVLFGSSPGNDPPDPDFTVDCDAAPACDFTDSSSDDGSIQDWYWNFDDGTTSSVQHPPTHTFPENGTYDVSLTVTDDDGVSSTKARSVLVGEPGPPVVFAVNAGGNEMTVDGVTYEGDREGDPHRFHTGDDNEDDTNDGIDNTSADDLYQTMRHGDDRGFECDSWPFGCTWVDPGPFGYEVPVPDGEYEVTFRFAEIDRYWRVDNDERVFDVAIEGGTEISSLDLYETVGTDYSYDVARTVTVSDGGLSIQFNPDSNELGPSVNAIEVRQLDAVSYDEGADTPEQVVMEAEGYHRELPGNHQDASGDDMSGDDWVEVNDASASATEAMDAQSSNGPTTAGDTENGPRLDYYVNVTNPDAEYYVWVRMNCPSVGSADDSIHVGVDGEPVTYGGSGMNGNASTKCNDVSGWTWVSHAAGNQASVDLGEPGQHTINVWMNDDGVQIDKVVLTTEDDGTYVPTGSGPAVSQES